MLIVRVHFIRKMQNNSQLQAHPPALPGGLEYALLSKAQGNIAVQNSQTLNLSLVLLTLILNDSDGTSLKNAKVLAV